jgi:hypothetical protein
MQFRLSTLFLLFVVLWSSLAVFGVCGGAVFCIVLAMAVIIYKIGWAYVLLGWIAMSPVLLLACLVAVLACISPSANECAEKMRDITSAMMLYQKANGRFPPASFADHGDKSGCSWRVLLLPFLKHNELFQQYELKESWDSPKNITLLDLCPSVYRCDTKSTSMNTHYLAVIESKSSHLSGFRKIIRDCKGLESSTVWLIETPGEGIPWTKPQDFDIDSKEDVTAFLDDNVGSVHSRNHTFFYDYVRCGECNVVTVDGVAHKLNYAGLTPQELHKLFCVGGFDAGKVKMFSQLGRLTVFINWSNCLSLVIWLLSVVSLFHRVWLPAPGNANAANASEPS